jgi:hypothetical protein
MHDEHEGTDMQLGEEFQATVPDYQGPPPALGEHFGSAVDAAPVAML